MPDTRTLPTDVKLTYLAEGAANVVYRILPPDYVNDAATPSRAELSSIFFNKEDLHELPTAESSSTPPPTEIEPDFSRVPEVPSYQLRGKLLRLHKDVPWIPSYARLYHKYKSLVAPLFDPMHVVEQRLILLPLGLTTACNDALRNAESVPSATQPFVGRESQVIHSASRSQRRHNLYLSIDEPYGLLIEDMSVGDPNKEILIELKPKWLVQSPNAPVGSKRCRTCALRAMRAAKKRKTGTGMSLMSADSSEVKRESMSLTSEAAGQDIDAEPARRDLGAQLPGPARIDLLRPKLGKAFCPLNLVPFPTAPPDVLDIMAEVLLKDHLIAHGSQWRRLYPDLQRALAGFLRTTPLLRHIASLQRTLDPSGIFALENPQTLRPLSGAAENDILTNFLIATTLRDCTLFIKLIVPTHLVHSDPYARPNIIQLAETIEISVQAKLADLDLKEAEAGKLAYWTGVERELIEGGWYEATDGTFTGCALESED